MQVGDHEAPAVTPHKSAIEAIARETGADLERVRMLFEREFAQLEAHAKVHGFLSVLAFRNVKLRLREHRGDAN